MFEAMWSSRVEVIYRVLGSSPIYASRTCRIAKFAFNFSQKVCHGMVYLIYMTGFALGVFLPLQFTNGCPDELQ